MNHLKRIVYVNEDTEPVSMLFRLRLPPLAIGLCLGVGISFVMSRFEEVLESDIKVAFFIPFIVYMADAVGTQTQTIFARALKTGKTKFHTYLVKESALGIILGLIFGGISAVVAHVWFNDAPLSACVGLSMGVAVATAPVISIFVTEAMQLLREDPAAGSGPIATVIQDTVSVLVYGLISSTILL